MCIVSRSEAARRSRRIKSERRNGQGTEDRTSSVRSFAHSPVHSLVSVLFVRCDSVLSSGVHTSALECFLLAGTCERRDVSARTHTHVDVDVDVDSTTSVATFVCVFRFGTRCNIAAGRRKNDVAYVLLSTVARCGRRQAILKTCLALGNTFRVVIYADIVGLKNALRDVLCGFYIAINLDGTRAPFSYDFSLSRICHALY